MTHPPIKAPFELPQTEAGIEVVARWIEEGGPGVNLESTRKLMAATVRALSHPAAQAGAVQAVAKGMVLVPLVMTRAMQYAVEEEGWEWADLLAAACAVDEREYDIALSHSPGEVDPEQFLDTGLADVHDEGGVLTYYSKSAVLECISAALETTATTPATPSSGMTFEEAKDFASKAIYGADGRGMNRANRTNLTNRVARAILKAIALAATQPSAAPGDGQGGVAAEVLDETSTSIHATIYAPVLKEFCLEASREDEGRNWYIEVTDESGYHTYDGYWRDSALKSCAEVLAEAAEGSMLHEINPPPERALPLAAPGAAIAAREQESIDMVLHCPQCNLQHVDASDATECAWPQCSCADQVDRGCIAQDVSWTNPPHRSHLCHGCGHIWRPADVPTNGVQAVKTTGKADSSLASPAPAPTSQPNAAAQEQQAGWRWVPVEPTPAMVEAGAKADPERESVWAAYLAAAPTGMGSVGLPSGRGEEA